MSNKNLKFIHIQFMLILMVFMNIFATVPVQASISIIYVKKDAVGANNGTSWMDAYTNLRSALLAATSGSEVWVAAGTYKPTPTSNRAVSFILKNNVEIYGGFAGTETLRTQRDIDANVTILSGDIGVAGNNSDNSYHVVRGGGRNSTAILDGFTITAGNANGTLDDRYGAGMYNDNGSPTLKNIVFSKNSALANGGGITNQNDSHPILLNVKFISNTAGYGGGIYNNNSDPTLKDVTFNANSALNGGGMMNDNGSSPTLTNMSFIGNTATEIQGAGGGMFNYKNSSPILLNVTFVSNTSAGVGGGMSNIDDSSPSITNTLFKNNSATNYGGGMSITNNSNPTLTNVTFTSNASTAGGGLSIKWSSPIIKNVTLSGNNAVEGGGLYFESENALTLPNVANSILWGNPGGEIESSLADAPVVTYSIVQGGYMGTGNLDMDPLLGALTNNGGFSQTMPLEVGSPAIDAGDDAICAATDQREVARPQGLHCDIGAYEFSPIISVTSESEGVYDGWILESSETSSKGSALNSTATLIYVGDNAQDKQYRSILSFDTSGLPDDAVVLKVRLNLKVQGFEGGNMFTPVKTLGNLLVDIREPYFGANVDLVVNDFQAGGSRGSVGTLDNVMATGWYTLTLQNVTCQYINLTGQSQFRLRFAKDDNNDTGADYIKIYSGDAPTASRPQLIVEYYVP